VPLFPSPRSATRESYSPTVRRLQIFVLFNGQETTAKALRTAAAFVAGLGGEILVAAPQVVPYPLPLNCPSVDRRALVSQIKGAVSQSGITCAIQKVLIAYTRDDRDGWRSLLPPHCIVVVGKPEARFLIRRLRTWLSAKFLTKLGHEVLLA
jgi:hypothetical protein